MTCMLLLSQSECCAADLVQVELLAPPRLLGEYCLLADELPELCYRPATLRCGEAMPCCHGMTYIETLLCSV
jgi:hypothetical protein